MSFFNMPVFSFLRNGQQVPVQKDTVTPANSNPLPVEITSANGDVAINAANLHIEVQTSHVGANADSVRIGDGTDVLAINADGSVNIIGVVTATNLDVRDLTYASDSVTVAGVNPAGTNAEMEIGFNGGIKLDVSKNSFGNLSTSSRLPYISLLATRGLEERIFETYISGTGSFAGIVDNVPGRELSVTSGTSVGGYGVLRSKKALTYRPGIGMQAVFSARFTTPVAASIQRAGMFNIGNELTIGYDNLLFGFLRRSGGRPEIRTLTVATPTGTSVNLTVTLNGTPTVVAIVSGTAEANAYTIGAATYVGWTAYSVGATVIFQAASVNAQAGTFTATPSAGAFVGSFVRTAAGTAVVDTWSYQTAWNITTLTTGSDPFILDPLKGNLYSIQYTAGYAGALLSVRDPLTGQFVAVHRERISNTLTTPSIDLPQFKLGVIAASAGTTTSLTVTSSSMAGLHENSSLYPPKIHGTSADATGITTALTNLLAVKRTTVASGLLNLTDVLIEDIGVAVSGAKPVFMEVRLNPTFASSTLWTTIDEDTTLVKSITGGTVSGGELLYVLPLGKDSNTTKNMSQFSILLSADDVLSIGVRSSSTTTDALVAITWSET